VGGWYPKIKTDCDILFFCIASFREWATAGCRGERAICSREWLTAPPYVLLPQQEVTELSKLVTMDQLIPSGRDFVDERSSLLIEDLQGLQMLF
jgi:hypothetical protein